MNQKDRIDLLYLTNQNFADKYNKKITKNTNQNLKQDIFFYRKRILNVTKDLLREKSINKTIDSVFLEYAQELINYFKFIDKKDILQEEYKDLKEKKKKQVNTDFKLNESDKIMSRETKKTIKTIKDCIPIIVKSRPQKKKNYPKKKDINIKDPKFRIKGLEKEKSNQIICPEKQNIIKENLKKNTVKSKPIKQKKDVIPKKRKAKKEKKQLNLVAEILGK